MDDATVCQYYSPMQCHYLPLFRPFYASAILLFKIFNIFSLMPYINAARQSWLMAPRQRDLLQLPMNRTSISSTPNPLQALHILSLPVPQPHSPPRKMAVTAQPRGARQSSASTRPAWLSWKNWESVSVSLRGIPRDVNTYRLWEFFHKMGNVTAIDIFDDRHGRRSHQGRVRFR